MKEFHMSRFDMDCVQPVTEKGGCGKNVLLYVGNRYRRLIEADIALFGLAFELHRVPTIDDAWEMLKSRRFGAMIMDDGLVVAEGRSFMERLRRSNMENSAIPVRVVALRDQQAVRKVLDGFADVAVIPDEDAGPENDPFGFNRFIK